MRVVSGPLPHLPLPHLALRARSGPVGPVNITPVSVSTLTFDFRLIIREELFFLFGLKEKLKLVGQWTVDRSPWTPVKGGTEND